MHTSEPTSLCLLKIARSKSSRLGFQFTSNYNPDDDIDWDEGIEKVKEVNIIKKIEC